MTDSILLKQIGDLIDQKLAPMQGQMTRMEGRMDHMEGGITSMRGQITGIQKQLDTVELKVEAINTKVDKVHQDLAQRIDLSQQETIDTLSELIQTGHNLHEKRIKQLEKHAGFS